MGQSEFAALISDADLARSLLEYSQKMNHLSQEIDSLTGFKRDTAAFLDRLRETGKPLVLTVNGKATLVVQDVASYKRLLERADRLEAIEGIKRGFEDVKQGRTRPFEEVLAEKKKNYRL